MHALRLVLPILFLLCAYKNDAQTMGFFAEEYIVKASSLNLRDKADKSGKAIEKLPRGARLKFVEAWNQGEYVAVDDSLYGQWLKVKSPSGKTGYVFSYYLSTDYEVHFEDEFIDELPPLQWYGVYQRDSFADEIRKIDVRIEEAWEEMYGARMKKLKTNQKEPAKFLIATAASFTPGRCGPLGMFDPGSEYINNELSPGKMFALYPGQEEGDTTHINSWFLAATGCGEFEGPELVIRDLRVYLIDNFETPETRQDLTHWIQWGTDEAPLIALLWYGDLDGDKKPDMLLQDCLGGCRASLYLTSKTKPGEKIRKVCETFLPMD